ncbi:MAG: amidohydrolase [Bacillota bacterium]|nr:MAG: amidohydrolase [Bacillota bacterium]
MFDIMTAVKSVEQEVIQLRRHLHANPEVGYEEHATSSFIAEKLLEYGLEVQQGIGGTGVVGVLAGAQPGPCVALRADMDALEVQEATGLPFAATNGKMHACGHDGHTAILLGVAKVLSLHRGSIVGTIKFLFQPAEECAPFGGAKSLIEAGAMNNPTVDYIYALHLWPDVPFGKVGLKSGSLMSASDRIRIDIIGKGGHGAIPHQAVDAVVVASQVVNSLQTIVSRTVDPLDAAVVTIGSLHAGQRYNVIAQTAHLDGTVRTQNEAVRKVLPERITTLVQSIAVGMGARAEINYELGYPTLYNNPQAINLLRTASVSVLGADSTVDLERPSMGGEDFAFFLDYAAGAMFWLGCKGPNTPDYPIHNAKFDFDESVMVRGMAVFCTVALLSLTQGV